MHTPYVHFLFFFFLMFFIFLLGMTEEMLHSFWIVDEKKQSEVSCVCAGLFDVELMYTLREISGTWKSLTQFFLYS